MTLREAAEHILYLRDHYQTVGRELPLNLVDAINVLERALAETKDMVLVPRVPTERMVQAAYDRWSSRVYFIDQIPDLYRAMLDAAGVPAADTQDEARDAARYRAYRELIKADKVKAQAMVWHSDGSRQAFDKLLDAAIDRAIAEGK